MKSKLITGIVLALFLMGMLTLAFNIQPVKASGTIYIRADGSIEPSTANITSVDNVTYTFNDNINDSIVVERDNIVVDGASYTLQGTGAFDSKGISLSGRSNVTIRNINIKVFFYGIWLYYSSKNTISGNNIANNWAGIRLESSFYNTISGNNITANDYHGIRLFYSSNNNTISGNNITANNGAGVFLESSSKNLVVENTFVNDGLWVYNSYGNVVEGNLVNGKPLVYLEGVSDYAVGEAGQIILVNCTAITVENLNISNTYIAVQLWETNNTKISSNNIANNRRGIGLSFSSNNAISGNNITANTGESIGLDYSSNNNTISGNNIANNNGGIRLYESSNNTISGNNIANNDKGIWLSGSSNYNVISGNNITANNYGGIEISESSNNAISGNNITAKNLYGILLYWWSSNNAISGNNIANNDNGIVLSFSSNNAISGNNIANNDKGIWLYYSSNNTIFHNNFIDNTQQVYDPTPWHANSWDNGYPSGGNYWSDYTGVDLFSGPYQNETGCDGIGDIPYVIDENNRDNYPLMEPYPDTTPPIITILSPENKTYATTSIPLTFTVDECARWIAYSLDGESNTTITGNTTLSGLYEGTHTITVYVNDTAGNMGASSTVYFTVDTTPPNITSVSQTPFKDNVLPEDEVKINATVTDLSGIKRVTLNYTNGNGAWVTVDMTNLEGNIWNATIPPFPYCTNVTYIVIAKDNANNTITSEELGYDTQYHVIPEFPTWTSMLLILMVLTVAIAIYKRRILKTPPIH